MGFSHRYLCVASFGLLLVVGQPSSGQQVVDSSGGETGEVMLAALTDRTATQQAATNSETPENATAQGQQIPLADPVAAPPQAEDQARIPQISRLTLARNLR